MTADAAANQGTKKRKQDAADPPRKAKSHRPSPSPQKAALIGPHEAIVSQLQAKYDVHVASVLSSTQIRTRVEHAVAYLKTAIDRPRVVLLHARPAQVCKMITVAEQCKRFLAQEGKPWFQYNQMFDAPPRAPKVDKVDETVLDKDAGDSDSDDFEVMSNRFEKAVNPSRPERTIKSLRILLSASPLQEVETQDGVTVQRSASTGP